MTVATGYNYTPGVYWLGRTVAQQTFISPVLSAVDSQDGTGAVVTVSHSDRVATNYVFVARMAGTEGAFSWESADQRVGNGDLALTLEPGHYFAYVASRSGASLLVSSPIYFAVTDSTSQAVHYQCLLSTQARLRILALAGISAEDIRVKKLPLEMFLRDARGKARYPAILVTPAKPIMNPQAGTTHFDDVVYGVVVSIVDADNQEATGEANVARNTRWLEQVARAFRHQRLPGASTVYECTVVPYDVVVPPAWVQGLLVSALQLNFTSREPRGM